jgi:hypothetical protein
MCFGAVRGARLCTEESVIGAVLDRLGDALPCSVRTAIPSSTVWCVPSTPQFFSRFPMVAQGAAQ